MMLLPLLLKRMLRHGEITVIDPRGTRHRFGPGGGASVTMRLNDDAVERALFLNPELALPEAYMDGRIDFVEGSTVHDLLRLLWTQRTGLHRHPLQRMVRGARYRIRRWRMHNPIGTAARKVRHHYDIPTAFYRLWLDESMTYSCAYWPTPDITLAEAQRAKLRHVAAKLAIEPGMSVLDIGSGWGGLAIYLAQACGAKVTGLNVSPEQIKAAREAAEAKGVADRVTFVEADYRTFQGRFDRIVSIGMMEHVGIAHFGEYFGAIQRLMAPEGMALVHCIGRAGVPGFTGPFFEKYIFPGGYAPSLSEVFAAVEPTGLWSSDCEFLRKHYYWTLAAWRRTFLEKRAEIVAMMDERFARMWEFYLSACEVSFELGGDMVFQLMLGHHKTAVPVTRDYVTDGERRLAAAGF